MGDFDVAFEKCGLYDGLGELISHAHGLLGTSRDVGIEAVRKGGTLLLGVGLVLVIELSRKRRIVGDVGVGELDFGALLLSNVCRWRVGAEGVLKVLLRCLGEFGGNGLEGGED